MATTITPTVHRGPYAAINPAHPEHSQAGHTILVTGGSKGIGFAIARSFAQAAASRIVIVGRSRTTLDTAIARIRSEVPGFKGQVIPAQCDLGDAASVKALCSRLDEECIAVDVLVLNAARTQEESSMLNLGWEQTWQLFETNVRGNLMMVIKLMGQSPSPPKAIINVSSPFVHDNRMSAGFRPYAISKSTLAWTLEHLAEEVPQEQTQIVSFHPGFIFTEGMKEAGCTPDDMEWDHENLPGNFAVWAASNKAAFLHGRFAWAKWDVEELSRRFPGDVLRDSNFLRLGIHGI